MSSTSEIADALHSGMVRLNKKVAMVDRHVDLSAARLSILAVLSFGGSQTVGSLAQIEGVRPPTITNLIDALEADGMVKREKCKTDGRQSRLSVTPKGRKILESARQNRLTYLNGMIDVLSEVERATLKSASQILLKLSNFKF